MNILGYYNTIRTELSKKSIMICKGNPKAAPGIKPILFTQVHYTAPMLYLMNFSS